MTTSPYSFFNEEFTESITRDIEMPTIPPNVYSGKVTLPRDHRDIMKPDMRALPVIQKTREYLDYVERHINNVARAWEEIQEKCKDMSIIYDDLHFWSINAEIERHDLSKLSAQEFIQYREAFYPVDGYIKGDMTAAWDHHKAQNNHHWENWTNNKKLMGNNHQAQCCTHMVVDWLAMSYEVSDSPRAFYERNKDKIKLPDWAVKFIYEIFDCLDGKQSMANMTPEQKERLLTEAQETAGRLNKLNAFMASSNFPGLPTEDKDLMYEQQRAMSSYVQVLGKRLQRAGEQFEHPTEEEA